MTEYDEDIFLPNGRVRPDVTDDATAQALRDSLAHARSTNWDSVRTPHLFLGLLGTPDAAVYAWTSRLGADMVIHVDPATGHQHVLSSRGNLQAPVDIAAGADGSVFVVDMVGDKLIRIDAKTGAQTVLAQGGLLAGIRSVEVFGV